MPFGTEVCLIGPGHIVLDEDPASLPPEKNGHSPNFRSTSAVAKRLHESILWPFRYIMTFVAIFV